MGRDLPRWNEGSRRCFESLGFRACEATEKGDRLPPRSIRTVNSERKEGFPLKTAQQLLRRQSPASGFFSRRGEVLAPDRPLTGLTMIGGHPPLDPSVPLGHPSVYRPGGRTGPYLCRHGHLPPEGGKPPPHRFCRPLSPVGCSRPSCSPGTAGKASSPAQGQFAGKEAVLSGTVSSVVRREDGGSSFLLKNASVTADDGPKAGRTSSFTPTGNSPFDGGERVRLRAELSDELTPLPDRDGSGTDGLSPGIPGRGGGRFLAPPLCPPERFPHLGTRRGFTPRCPREMRERHAGMLLGSREQLESDVYALLQWFRASSTSSRCRGLHIAVFFSLTQLILRRAGKRAALLISIPLAGLYVFLTGASVPSVRSFVMIAFMALAEVLFRPEECKRLPGAGRDLLLPHRPDERRPDGHHPVGCRHLVPIRGRPGHPDAGRQSLRRLAGRGG